MEKISSPKIEYTRDAHESYLTRVSDNLFTDPDHPEREPRSRSIVYVPYRGFSKQLQQTALKLPLQILMVQRLLEPCLRLMSSSILLAVKRLLKQRLDTQTGM